MVNRVKFDIVFGNNGRCVLRAKEEGDLPCVLSAFSSKASISDGMGVHKSIWLWAACIFWKAL